MPTNPAQPGQPNWKSRGSSKNEYVVEALIEKKMSYEYRYRSAIGKLSKPMPGRTLNDRSRMRDQAIDGTAVIRTQTINKGDEARFTLTRNIDGAMTYGDAPVRDGDYLAYMHCNVRLNAARTPAYRLTEEMSKHRAMDLVKGEESELRQQINMRLAQEYAFEAYRGFLLGASLGLRVNESEGGYANIIQNDLNRGLRSDGKAKQVSCPTSLVFGVGEVTAPVDNTTAELDNYEDRIAAAVGDANIAEITRGYVQDIRDWVVYKKIGGIDVGGQEKWFIPTDPAIMRDLTKEGGELYEAWKLAMQRDKSNPAFGYSYIELDDLVFFKDPYLTQFRPVLDGAGDPVIDAADGNAIQYGGGELGDMTRYTPGTNDTVGMMLVLGANALLEGNSGTVKVTKDEGKHEQGKTIAAHIKQSFQRTRWVTKDGTTEPELNQQMAVVFAKANIGGWGV